MRITKPLLYVSLCYENTKIKEISMAETLTQQNSTAFISENAQEGKYLTFSLGAEEFGLEILKVREIIGYIDVTAIPRTADYVKGVINLRGQVIPVVNLRLKFGMKESDVTDQTCIIVVETIRDNKEINVGIIVDRVQEVLDINEQDIDPSPQFSSSVDTDFILGIAKIGESIKILLSIDKVLQKGALSACLQGTAAAEHL